MTGAGGRRKATVAERSSAMVLFDKVLLSMDFPCYDDLVAEIKENKRSSKEICNIAEIQNIPTKLHEQQGFILYKSGMLLMYISGVNNHLQGHFPNKDVLKTACVNGS